MLINTISDLRKAFRHGPYAWLGGYPCYFIMADGEAMSFRAAKESRRELIAALGDPQCRNNGWRPVALEINWEDTELYCCQTGERIESAYGSDE